MFPYLPSDEANADWPPRKLLHIVLLMSVRDRAKCLRLEPRGPNLHMFYCAPDNEDLFQWFEMVPAPMLVWKPIVTILREHGTKVDGPPEFESDWTGSSSFLRRTIGRFHSNPDVHRFIGSFEHSIDYYRCRWVFQLHLHRERSDAILVPDLELGAESYAGELLKRFMPNDVTEFEP